MTFACIVSLALFEFFRNSGSPWDDVAYMAIEYVQLKQALAINTSRIIMPRMRTFTRPQAAVRCSATTSVNAATNKRIGDYTLLVIFIVKIINTMLSIGLCNHSPLTVRT